jgi:hypothetical protein
MTTATHLDNRFLFELRDVSLAQNGLDLKHYYTYGQGEFMAVLGLMNYCTAVARRSH